MALPANFLDELRARTPLPALIGRAVRLARSGREWKGCCPFHGEKTPSFYVYDDHFHCFGCGAHGDAITYVMKAQGASFMEAVESLAAEAGLEMPRPSPEAAEAEQRRAGLAEILEEAARAFQRRLFLPEGAAALAYLRGRGLADETIRAFGLGWSGEGRGALAADLARAGIAKERLVEAGLMKQGENGPVDMFFNRVMFPIRDRQGRCISFGGRTLGDGQPKYVNGPETALFSKRRSLYGLHLAREPVRKGADLLVVEGYMDVIALADAGFAAVAPLGTALTEEQLAELWRLAPQPILCFDGDAAGRRAALRAVELVLPKLTPERSARLMSLPEGEDPDTLVRKQGAGAMRAAIAGADALTTRLYDLLAEGASLTTPEGRAAFSKRLDAAAATVEDRTLGFELRQTLRDRFRAATSRRRFAGSRLNDPRLNDSRRPGQPLVRTPPSAARSAARRARELLAMLLAHPQMLPGVDEALSTLDLPPELQPVRAALHAYLERHQPLDMDSLLAHLTQSGLDTTARDILKDLPRDAAPGAPLSVVVDGWWELFGLMPTSLDSLRQQTEEAVQRMRPLDDPETIDRFKKINAVLSRTRSGERDDT